MQHIKNVLQHYRMPVLNIEQVSKRVHRVSIGEREVAVKKAKSSDIKGWLEAYRSAKDSHITQVIPVYLTQRGTLYTQYENDIYYVMPWVSHNKYDRPTYPYESFYKTLGQLHQSTVQEKQLNQTNYENYIKNQKASLQKKQEKLEGWIAGFEQRHYMAPIELQICTQYRNLVHIFDKKALWYDRWYEDVVEDKVLRYVRCHGNLKPSHFLYDESSPYFINWERSYIGSPAADLSTYFGHFLKFHDAPVEEIVNTFSSYEEQFSLLNSERSSLALHLLQPDGYFNYIERYIEGTSRDPQPFQVQKLERAHRGLINGLHVQEKLEQARDYVKSQEENKEN